MTSLPGHFWSVRRHVILCHVPATSRELLPCKSSNLHKHQFSALYSHFQVNSFKWQLPSHFRLREITWRHFQSPDWHLEVTALEERKLKQNTFLAFYSHFQVTQRNDVTSRSLPIMRSRDVISCHVTATSCKLQPCRIWKLHKSWVFALLQPLPGDFRWNESFRVTFGHVRSRDVISCHVTVTSCELQPCWSSYLH